MKRVNTLRSLTFEVPPEADTSCLGAQQVTGILSCSIMKITDYVGFVNEMKDNRSKVAQHHNAHLQRRDCDR